MQKNIALSVALALAAGVDALDSYTAFKAGIVDELDATGMAARLFSAAPSDGGLVATIVVDVVVASTLDWIEHFEAVRAAIATALDIDEVGVSILSAEESEIPE